MASGLYKHAEQGFLNGTFNLLTDTLKVVLVNIVGPPVYTVDFTNDQFLSAIPLAARISTTSALTSPSITLGVFNAANTQFVGVPVVTCQALVLFKDTGLDTTSPLIGYFDNYTGLPVTGDGGNINLNWDTGVNQIFKVG